MSKTRAEVNSYFHGSVDIGHGATADYVIDHAARQRQKGKGPSVAYKGTRNPRAALEMAEADRAARANASDPLGHTSKFSGRVATLHVWGQDQVLAAGKYAEARIEHDGAAGAIVRADLGKGSPIELGVKSNGTVEVQYPSL